MEREVRHDGAVCAPCPHCGRRPRYVMTVPNADAPTTHRLECPLPDCGTQTGEHEVLQAAIDEWDSFSEAGPAPLFFGDN